MPGVVFAIELPSKGGYQARHILASVFLLWNVKSSILPIDTKMPWIPIQYMFTPWKLESAKYLGYTCKKNLNLNKHINKGKLSISLHFKQNLCRSSDNIIELSYKSLVRHTLGNAATVWDPQNQINIHRIELVQRRKVRFVERAHRKCSINSNDLRCKRKELKWN